MSASTSSDLLRRARAGERVPREEVLAFGDLHPAEFFREVIEPLCDSFDEKDAAAYERLMQSMWGRLVSLPWTSHPEASPAYVLSRVTLGADIKITSVILDALKDRNPIFVGSKKSAELFPNVENLIVDYPRKATLSERFQFAVDLRHQLKDGIVIDPDSRLTQLGMIPMGQEYFHFNSRIAGGESNANLSQLINDWLQQAFGVTGKAFLNPERFPIDSPGPRAAISLGVGENETKRIPGDFESTLIRELATEFESIWIDRGAGGEEAARVTAAAEQSGALSRIHFWDGSFASFASIISQSDYYAGYDSAGQHAAAAAGVPLTTYFAGAPSERFAARWAPWGEGPIKVVRP